MLCRIDGTAMAMSIAMHANENSMPIMEKPVRFIAHPR